MDDNQKTQENSTAVSRWLDNNPRKVLAVSFSIFAAIGADFYNDYRQDQEARTLVNPDDIVTRITVESNQSYYIDNWDERPGHAERFAKSKTTLQECVNIARNLTINKTPPIGFGVPPLTHVTCYDGEIQRITVLASGYDFSYWERDERGYPVHAYDGFN